MFELKGVEFLDILNISHMKISGGLITSITGPSGSGKTTILKMLNRLITPTKGIIYYNGTELSKTDPVLHRRQVMMLSQTPVIFEGSIKDNLVAGHRFQRRQLPDEDRLSFVLKSVNLDKKLDSSSAVLSGGEKQRLALARVLLLDPVVYLMDEPSSALDDHTAQMIIEMITKHVREDNKTLIMVTHSKEIAKRFSDQMIEIRAGGKETDIS